MAARQKVDIDARRRTAVDSGMYVYGNTVRKAQAVPQRRRGYEEQPQPKKAVSPQVKKNRKRALKMNPAYLLFLTFATVITLAACVWYIQLRTEVSGRAANIAAMQKELVELKEENTARYNSIVDSVNLEEVRERAVKDLGMVYAGDDQIVTYQNPKNDYVEQYEEIPEDGILEETE